MLPACLALRAARNEFWNSKDPASWSNDEKQVSPRPIAMGAGRFRAHGGGKEPAHNPLAGVVGETVVAEIQQSNAVRQELEPLKLAAAERRGKARLALTEHEAASHQNRKRA